MTLSGFDIANVNGPGALARTSSGAFVILKASEGSGFHDGYHDGWAAQVRASGKLLGHYHYAHVTNSPVAEADWFVACAKPQHGETMVLDFEPYGQPVSDASFPGWACAFLARVNQLTGARCWLYLNDDMAGRMTSHATTAQLQQLRAAPLWKARYSSSPGSSYGWPSMAAWQWGGTGIDSDVFYGDLAAWRATGAGGASTAAPATPSAPAVSLTKTPTLNPEDYPAMFVLVHPQRGINLAGPGFLHHFNTEEWSTFHDLFVVPGLVRVKVFDPSTVGLRQYDLTAAILTQPSA